jgi:hypothetical protein
LDLKYNGLFSKLFNRSDTFKISKVEVDLIKAWTGRLQLASTELEKIRNKISNLQTEQLLNTQLTDLSNDIWSAYSMVLKAFCINNQTSNQLIFSKFKKINNIIKYSVNCQEVYRQLKSRNFSGAVSSVLSLMDSIRLDGNSAFLIKKDDLKSRYIGFVASDKDLSKEFKSLFDAAENNEKRLRELGITIKDTATFEVNAKGLGATIIFKREKIAYQNILKLAGFLGDISATRADSKKLRKIIESYAMPAQSYKRKRNSWISVDLNAYVGAYYGYENISRTMDQPAQRGGRVYGLSAPIGISISKTITRKAIATGDRLNGRGITSFKFGNRVRYKTKSNLTLALSAVDLGAVVSYRITNMDSTLPQQIKWQQLVSPGVQLQYGLPSTPLVLAIGMQYTPALRKFEDNAAKSMQRQYNAVRFSTGIYFDIPLFNLWSKD